MHAARNGDRNLVGGDRFIAGGYGCSRRGDRWQSDRWPGACQGGPAGPIYFRQLVIDHAQVPATQSDFPVLVTVSDPTLKTVANGGHVQRADGFDIGFYSDLGISKLKWDMERYDGSSGEVIAWVKHSSVSSLVDTVFYMRYGDNAITTFQGDAVNAWTNNFISVYHLKDGTTLSGADVLGVQNMVNTGVSATSGKIDGGGNFVAANSAKLESGAVTNPPAMSTSAWVNGVSFPTAYNTIISHGFSGSDYLGMYVKNNGKLFLHVFAASDRIYDGTGINTLVPGNWYHVVMTYDSTSGLVGYVNGSVDGTVTPNGPVSSVAVANTIGQQRHTSSFYWNGKIDEVRYSSIARSASWIATEYNNQNSPGTFVIMGAEQ